MVAAGVAVGILVFLFSLGLGVFLFLLDRRGRTKAEQAHWNRWEAQCRTATLHDWEAEGWA